MLVPTGSCEKFSFSLRQYRIFLESQDKKFILHDEINTQTEFVFLRHDIEVSLDRARSMAALEFDIGIRSTYLVQINSPYFNLLHRETLNKVKDIIEMGHDVGLHFRLSDDKIETPDYTESLIASKNSFEHIFGYRPKFFSFHRPNIGQLSTRSDLICGMFNLYGPSFFNYKHEESKIKYIADSRHRFDYGDLSEVSRHDRVHLLVHPDEWSEGGDDDCQNILSLVKENESSCRSYLVRDFPRLRGLL
jgi:hypothetical protein